MFIALAKPKWKNAPSSDEVASRFQTSPIEKAKEVSLRIRFYATNIAFAKDN